MDCTVVATVDPEEQVGSRTVVRVNVAIHITREDQTNLRFRVLRRSPVGPSEPGSSLLFFKNSCLSLQKQFCEF